MKKLLLSILSFSCAQAQIDLEKAIVKSDLSTVANYVHQESFGLSEVCLNHQGLKNLLQLSEKVLHMREAKLNQKIEISNFYNDVKKLILGSIVSSIGGTGLTWGSLIFMASLTRRSDHKRAEGLLIGGSLASISAITTIYGLKKIVSIFFTDSAKKAIYKKRKAKFDNAMLINSTLKNALDKFSPRI